MRGVKVHGGSEKRARRRLCEGELMAKTEIYHHQHRERRKK